MLKIYPMKNIRSAHCFFILLCLLTFSSLQAQYSQTAKIVSDNREDRAEYGTAVHMLGDFAIVGASRETIAEGAAYVYSRDSQGNWNFFQKLKANDPKEMAEYGGGVKLASDFLVVASGRADIGSTIRAGALYVYNLQNNVWELNTKLVASDFSGDAKLGMNPTSLDVQDNTIIAGAPGENAWIGSVYVFTKDGGTWTETQKILSPNPQVNDTFGIGVSVSGDDLLIGAQGVDQGKGAAYIYRKNPSGEWEFVQTLVASDAANEDYFGSSVSISENQLVIGAYGKNGEAGAAYVFEKNSQGIWSEVQKLTGNSSASNTQFGWSTDIQTDYMVVSAPRIYGNEVSEVYFYKRESNGLWVEEQIIQGSDTTLEDVFGWSVAMFQNKLICGAPWSDLDENGNNHINSAGAAYIFLNPTMLGVPFITLENKDIQLYPNPTRNSLIFKSFSTNISAVKLYAISGALVSGENNIGNRIFAQDVSQFEPGVYFAKITFEDGTHKFRKFIKK